MARFRMSSEHPAQLSPLNQRRLFRLRFLEAAGVQFGYLLAPLLALTLTKSLALMGMSLIMDGIARAFSMSFSGALLSRWGGARVHLVNESVRAGAMVVFLLVAAGTLPPAFVVVGAFGVQLATSSSLILYAHAITSGWPAHEQASVHHKQAYVDQAGGLVALAVGLTGAAPWLLAGVAVLTQVLTVGALVRWRRQMHLEPPEALAPLPVWQQMWRDFKACQNRQIRWFAVAGAILGAAALVGMATPSFLVYRAGVPVEQAGAWLSGALMLKVVVSLLVLQMTRRHARTNAGSILTGRMGLVVLTLGLMAQAVVMTPWLTVLATAAMGVGIVLLTPHVRYLRQALVYRTTPAVSHAGASGLLAAWDVVGFCLAGLVLLGFSSLAWVLATAAALNLLAGVMLERSNSWLLRA